MKALKTRAMGHQQSQTSYIVQIVKTHTSKLFFLGKSSLKLLATTYFTSPTYQPTKVPPLESQPHPGRSCRWQLLRQLRKGAHLQTGFFEVCPGALPLQTRWSHLAWYQKGVLTTGAHGRPKGCSPGRNKSHLLFVDKKLWLFWPS